MSQRPRSHRPSCRARNAEARDEPHKFIASPEGVRRWLIYSFNARARVHSLQPVLRPVGSVQKPSARAHSGALPSLWSNAQMGAARRVDRPHTSSARRDTAGSFSSRVLSAATRGTEKQAARGRARQSWVKRHVRESARPARGANYREPASHSKSPFSPTPRCGSAAPSAIVPP